MRASVRICNESLPELHPPSLGQFLPRVEIFRDVRQFTDTCIKLFLEDPPLLLGVACTEDLVSEFG